MPKRRNGNARESLREALRRQQIERGELKNTPEPTHHADLEEGIPLPSQAEGERELEQQSKDEVMDLSSPMGHAATTGVLKEPKPIPSQAEGERETIEEDLDAKGLAS